MSLRVVLATGNRGKVREFSRLLPGLALEPLPADHLLPEETGSTFEENARIKAEAVFGALGGSVAVLADDSGLEVDVLSGRPGIRSARFAGPDADDRANVRRLLEELGSAEHRAARFVCALVLLLPTGRSDRAEVVEVVGDLRGTIEREPRGQAGFGYDPVFRPEGWDRTLAEATGEEKDRVSHRGAAARALRKVLQTKGLQ